MDNTESMSSTLTEDEEDSSSSYSSEKHSGNLIQNFEYFRKEGGYSDVTLKVGPKSFPSHKIILAAGSPYFKSMFESGMEESRKSCIEIKEVDEIVFEKVLHFIYTGKVEITSFILQELFGQSCMFQVTALVDLCVRHFRLHMTENNCLVALTLADLHAHKNLYNYAREFVCMKFRTVSQEEDICRLSADCIKDILSYRSLDCNGEEQVFEFAIKWLDFEEEKEKRKNSVYKILSCVKFPHLNRSYLTGVVAKSPYLADDEGKELLENAMIYHLLPARRPMLPSYQITPRSSRNIEVAVLLGGRLADGLSNDVECYKSDTKEFFALKQLPFKKRNEFAACVLGNDIYVSGGLRSGEFWKFDYDFATWIRGISLVQPRRRHAMAPVDESIYVLGGFDEDSVLHSVEVWKPGENQWKFYGRLASPVENMGYVAFGSCIYLFGGKNQDEVVTNTVQCFNTESGQATILEQSLPVSDMCVSAAVLNNFIYVVGLEGSFKFHPDNKSWEVLPDMSCPRDFVSLTVLDEKLYAFGGRRRGAQTDLYTDIIEFFDPKKNAWERCGTIPVPMYSYGCVRVILGEKYLSFGASNLANS
ncbi:kelch-like protein 24 [Ostrea edulis]|uniref:kelch-like protein 24 n=1 Tax=Ostrea edulis TaxID=37623 RepID=UPI00209404B2|nr:kelch-like protein 24 [Ostrea edulis]